MPVINCKRHGQQTAILVCVHLTTDFHSGKTNFSSEKVYNEELLQEHYLCSACQLIYKEDIVANKETPGGEIEIHGVCLTCAREQNLAS